MKGAFGNEGALRFSTSGTARSWNAMGVYACNVIEMQEHAGDFKRVVRVFRVTDCEMLLLC
jgi:hypothetical protein